MHFNKVRILRFSVTFKSAHLKYSTNLSLKRCSKYGWM